MIERSKCVNTNVGGAVSIERARENEKENSNGIQAMRTNRTMVKGTECSDQLDWTGFSLTEWAPKLDQQNLK